MKKYRLRISYIVGFASALAFLLLVILLVASSVYSKLSEIPRTPEGILETTPNSKARHYNLVVCLTGGRGRIRLAMEYFERGIGSRLLISGVDPSVNMPLILKELGWVGPIEDSSKIIIDQDSRSTIENAEVVRDFLKDENVSKDSANSVKRVLVVTSSYHVKRAYFIFRKILPPEIQVDMAWTEREPFSQKDWWKSDTGILVTVTEFFKFFLAYLRLIWGI